MEQRRENARGAAGAGEARSQRCALILVDLDAPEGCDEVLREVLARVAQQTRFAAVVDASGVIAGDARGVLVSASLDSIVSALSAVTA